MVINQIFKNLSTINYLSFISGIQIAACIHLFILLYDMELSGQKMILFISGCVFLFISGFLSATISWDINSILLEGTRAEGTNISRELVMDKKMDSLITLKFGTYKFIRILVWSFLLDLICTIFGLILIILPKFIEL